MSPFHQTWWRNFGAVLFGHNWNTLLTGTPSECVHILTSAPMDGLALCVHHRWISDDKGTHPWFNAACHKLIADPEAARGFNEFEQIRDECSRGILGIYYEHQRRTKDKLMRLKRGTREWWKLASALLSRTI